VCKSQHQQLKEENCEAFLTQVIHPGEISVRSVDKRCYARIGHPIHTNIIPILHATMAASVPSHSYGTILQLVADLIPRHNMLNPEVMAELEGMIDIDRQQAIGNYKRQSLKI